MLRRLTSAAVATGLQLLTDSRGSPTERRAALLDDIPDAIGYYSDGSAALAADYYEEERELANPSTALTASLALPDRTVKQRRAVAWATDPLFLDEPDEALVGARLAQVVQLHTASPYRQTILDNWRRDDFCIGWRRITRGGCRFCRMLADRGAVYREATAQFAAHESCSCTAQAVFRGQDPGEEASVMQYMASKRNRTPEQRARIREYLDSFYPED